MNHQKSLHLLELTLIGLLVSETGTMASVPHPNVPSRSLVNSSNWQLTLKFNLPSRGAPGKRQKGAASRGSCPPLGNPGEELTALVPGTNLGLTVSERPTFWFYVPYSTNNRLDVEFSLQDREGKSLYQQIFPLAGTPGIVSVTLPTTESPLEVGLRS